MNRFIRTLVLVALSIFSTAAITQQKSQLTIETDYSKNQLAIEKQDKGLNGNRLVFGSVLTVRKQIGIDGIKVINRKAVYNCARNEFVIKEVTAFDKSDTEIKTTSIKTDVIMTPESDLIRREVDFMCSKGE